ncbi:hypothetical protein AB6A40_008664 [Gnathostoma spinigerum]|uniref:ATP synthase subunit d, mitochondrial n=1 Tax=Gnathostoma spinigerum TaxID=75299 RepID=A0ABD6EQZ1_9BILA
MAAPAKRVAFSSVNWKALADRLTSKHAAELSALKGQNSHFSGIISLLPADLPKYDFAALKKEMPSHAAIIDSLQKQYESLKIPYGTIPEKYVKEIEEWKEYNNARIKLHDMKTTDKAVEVSKVEEKWAHAPPVEHFSHQHFVEYFPDQFYDLRYQNRIPDPCGVGFNDPDSIQNIEERFKDYKVMRRPDKEEGH